MNTLVQVLLTTSLILAVWGNACAGETAAKETSAAATEAPAATTEAPATPTQLPAAAPSAAPDATVMQGEASEAAAARTHTEETVEGAFGIPLGKPFEPSMVAKILKQEARTYGADDDVKVTGTHYEVEPKAPDENFQTYAVDTTPDGIVYEIRAWYVDEAKESQCEKTKRMAADLEVKYGTPRGKGHRGTWYSFRPPSDLTRSASLYAHRCKLGRYSVAFRDHAARKASLPSTADTGKAGESAGTKETVESSESPAPKEATAADALTESKEAAESATPSAAENATDSGANETSNESAGQ